MSGVVQIIYVTKNQPGAHFFIAQLLSKPLSHMVVQYVLHVWYNNQSMLSWQNSWTKWRCSTTPPPAKHKKYQGLEPQKTDKHKDIPFNRKPSWLWLPAVNGFGGCVPLVFWTIDGSGDTYKFTFDTGILGAVQIQMIVFKMDKTVLKTEASSKTKRPFCLVVYFRFWNEGHTFQKNHSDKYSNTM